MGDPASLIDIDFLPRSDYAQFSYENKIFVDSILHNRLTFRLRQDARRSRRHIWQAGFARR